MFVRPVDLPDDAVVATWSRAWGVEVESIEYAAVGFGSHHWHARADGQRWFLTVDAIGEDPDRLHRAMATAHALTTNGHSYVVGPVATIAGATHQRIDSKYGLMVFPFVAGETGPYGRYENHAERVAVIEKLTLLHDADPDLRRHALADDLAIPERQHLVSTLNELGAEWHSGPFAEPTRAALVEHGEAVTAALAAYDELAAVATKRRHGYVLTHGEPHRGNTIFTPDGVSLVDWDTVLLAPPERDLWALIHEDPRTHDDYVRLTNRALDPVALRMYRLWWDLCEIALFVADFRRPHAETADTRTAWQGLCTHLDPERWSDIKQQTARSDVGVDPIN